MGRKRTGRHYVEPHQDHLDIRIDLPSGERSRRVCLPAGTSKEDAKAQAIRLKAIAWSAGAVLATPPTTEAAGETVEGWGERWWQSREARGMSVKDEKCRWRKWILSAPIGEHVFGDLGIALVTREDVEDLVKHLDTQVRAESLSWKTATNAWGLLSKAMSDACEAKDRDLRARTDNPTQNVRPPDRGQRRLKAWLHPSEVTRVLSCSDVALSVRRAIALNVYLYTRPGELRALCWSDVDLAAGRVSVYRSTLRDGREKGTKTERPRGVPLEPTLLRLLTALRGDGDERIATLPPDTALSDVLRESLRRAGVTRQELFTTDRRRKQITWYDLRATGITWLAIRGLDPLKIMHRAGHEHFQTTQGYIREAESVGSNFGEVFPELPNELFHVAQSLPRVA